MADEQMAPRMSFEEAFGRLEQIVQGLEEGDLPLEETLQLYEQGVALSRYCQDLLDRAEQRVVLLLEKEGEIREVPFEDSSAGLE